MAIDLGGPSPKVPQFTNSLATTMHLDINSCFATLEQQANPIYRNKPVVVSASRGSYGCILASSYEAKALGIKTGMRVGEARGILPSLIVLSPDPEKYRYIHNKLRVLLERFSPVVISKSIDEFVVDLSHVTFPRSPVATALEIKKEIKREVGDYVTVSIGLAPNRILAKLGADLDKPDGLLEINHKNYLSIYQKISLTDFYGINTRTKLRLNCIGIVSVMDFYKASRQTLKSAFGSVLGHDWYYRLRGIELDAWETKRSVFGNSYVLPHPISHLKAMPILSKLVSKATRRLREAGYTTSLINLVIRYSDHTSHHSSLNLQSPHFDTREIYQAFKKLYQEAPHSEVKQLAVSCSRLAVFTTQSTLFGEVERSQKLMESLDAINRRYGDNTLHFAGMSTSREHVHDTIAFGR